MADHLLTVDLGNTNAKLGVWAGGALAAQAVVRTDPLPDFDRAWARHFGADRWRPARVVAVSVNPPVTAALREWVETRWGLALERVGHELPLALENRTRRPAQVGMDRLVNAFAAYRRTRRRTLVVDFGTAITCDLVDEDGAFLGGAIAPGLRMGLEALHARAALLPGAALRVPAGPIGLETVGAMNAGVFYGALGLLETAARRVPGGDVAPPPLLLTGGDAALISPQLALPHEVVPTLTLEGLAALAAGSAEC